MPHVSKYYKLSGDEINQLTRRIADAAFLIKNRGDALSFFNDLLSSTEKVMLGRRLLIAMMLEKGFSYFDIRQRLKVSDPTISSVSERMKVGRGFKAAIKQLERQESIDVLLEQFMKPVQGLVRNMPKIAYIRRSKKQSL